MLQRPRLEVILSLALALASPFLLPFLEDQARRLSGHPLSDKYPTSALV